MQREIKVQQEIVNNSLKSVEEQLPKSNQGIIKNLMNRIRNGKKITKNHSAPVSKTLWFTLLWFEYSQSLYTENTNLS